MLPNLIDKLKNNIHTIRAGYADFAVKYLSHVLSDGVEVDGTTDFNSKVVEINCNLCDDAAKEVMYHELTHIVLEIAGLGEDSVTRPPNEEMTTNISRAFMSIIRNNKQLFDILEEF